MTQTIDSPPMDQQQPKKSKKGLIAGIITAAVVILLVVAFIIVSTPKMTLGLVLNNVSKTSDDIFNELNAELGTYQNNGRYDKPFYNFAEIALGDNNNNNITGMLEQLLGGKLGLKIESGYINKTGEGMMNIAANAGGTDILSVGTYLKGKEVAIISNELLSQTYVVEFDEDFDESKEMTLQEKLNALQGSSMSSGEELNALANDILMRLHKNGDCLVKNLKKENLSKGKEEITALDNGKNYPYIQIKFDDPEDLKELLLAYLKVLEEDEELEKSTTELVEMIYQTNTARYENMDIDFDMNDFDYEEMIDSLEEAIEEIDFEELTLKIYYQGFKPIGNSIEYEDKESKFNNVFIAYKDKDVTIINEFEDDVLDTDLSFSLKGKEVSFKLNDPDIISIDFSIEEQDDVLVIDGDIKTPNNDFTGDISGEITHNDTKTETEFELTLGEGLVIKFDNVNDEVKKNAKYVNVGNIEIVSNGETYDFDINGEAVYGKDASLDMESWGNDVVKIKSSADQEETLKFFQQINEDFSNATSGLIN